MMSNKTISFRAEDTGFSATVEKMRSKVNELTESLLRMTVNLGGKGGGSGDTVSILNRQIKIFERKNKINLLNTKENIRQKYEDEISDRRSWLEDFKNRPGVHKLQVEQRNQEVKEQISNLEREREKELKLADRENKILVELVKELIFSIKESAEDQIRTDREGVRETIAAINDDAPAEDQVRARIQRDILRRQSPEQEEDKKSCCCCCSCSDTTTTRKGVLGDVVLGTLIGNLLRKINQIGINIADSSSEQYLSANLLQFIPAIGGFISAADTRYLNESQEVAKALNRLRGTTGGGGAFTASQYGFDISETLPIAEQIARTIGMQRDYKDIP